MTANVFFACSEIRFDAGICDMIVLACLERVGIDSYNHTFSSQFVLDYRNERCRGMAVDGFLLFVAPYEGKNGHNRQIILGTSLKDFYESNVDFFEGLLYTRVCLSPSGKQMR